MQNFGRRRNHMERRTPIWLLGVVVIISSAIFLLKTANGPCVHRESYNRTEREMKFNRVLRSIREHATSSRTSFMHEFALQRLLTADFVPPLSVEADQFWTFRPPISPTTSLNADDVVVLMVGSSRNIKRSELMAATWLRMLPNTFIFSDIGNVSSIPQMITLPEIAGKQSHDDAGHRQLHGMRWLRANKPTLLTKKWFLFVDDDTWINVPALLHYFYTYNEALPLAFGYIWDQIWSADDAFLSGGAGIVFSRKAFSILANEIFGKKELCQMTNPQCNDLPLSRCSYANHVLKVHSTKFDWHDTAEYANDYTGMISVHYARNPQKVRWMTCEAILSWKYNGGGEPDNCTKHSSWLRAK